MRRRYEIRVILGVLIWVGLIGVAGLFMQRSISDAAGPARQLIQFATNRTNVVELNFDSLTIVQVGDPIYDSNDTAERPIGRITRVEHDRSTEIEPVFTRKAFAEFFSHAPALVATDQLTWYDTPGSTGWVVQTMLPPSVRSQIGELILNSYRDNQKEIVNALRPIVEETLRDASQIIREDFIVAFDRREQQINDLSQRFQSDLIQKEIIPLIKDEIWPIIQSESTPLAEKVGREIWQEVSVWRFTWRFLYDSTPLLPQRDLARKEFQRFLDEKGVPILQSHIPDFIDVQKKILSEVSQNRIVKKVVAKSIREVVYDEEVQALLKDVFTEVFVNNPRLHSALEEKWNTPEARAALALTNDRLDPTITSIGQVLFGSLDTAITPEFARVLRHKIMNKDARWLVLQHSESATESDTSMTVTSLPVVRGDSDRSEAIHPTNDGE